VCAWVRQQLIDIRNRLLDVRARDLGNQDDYPRLIPRPQIKAGLGVAMSPCARRRDIQAR